jgi:hypothetical protein
MGALGPVMKRLREPLSNIRGSDALSEPRTLESGCGDWTGYFLTGA